MEIEGNFLHIQCPHCGGGIIVKKADIRCTIFRHGAMKKDLAGINPHETRERCELLKAKGSIYGCGKPFSFDGQRVAVCGYI